LRIGAFALRTAGSTVDLEQAYDEYGNMTTQSASLSSSPKLCPALALESVDELLPP
jgi:hypothetical protein